MARVRTDFNIPLQPTRSPAHCAEHFLATFHAGVPADDPIRQRITAAEVTRLRKEATPETNPAQVGYSEDEGKILYLKMGSLYGINSRELLRDVLITAQFKFPE
eukprot:1644649-Rhodomonas_salina.1